MAFLESQGPCHVRGGRVVVVHGVSHGCATVAELAIRTKRHLNGTTKTHWRYITEGPFGGIESNFRGTSSSSDFSSMVGQCAWAETVTDDSLSDKFTCPCSSQRTLQPKTSQQLSHYIKKSFMGRLFQSSKINITGNHSEERKICPHHLVGRVQIATRQPRNHNPNPSLNLSARFRYFILLSDQFVREVPSLLIRLFDFNSYIARAATCPNLNTITRIFGTALSSECLTWLPGLYLNAGIRYATHFAIWPTCRVS